MGSIGDLMVISWLAWLELGACMLRLPGKKIRARSVTPVAWWAAVGAVVSSRPVSDEFVDELYITKKHMSTTLRHFERRC